MVLKEMCYMGCLTELNYAETNVSGFLLAVAMGKTAAPRGAIDMMMRIDSDMNQVKLL